MDKENEAPKQPPLPQTDELGHEKEESKDILQVSVSQPSLPEAEAEAQQTEITESAVLIHAPPKDTSPAEASQESIGDASPATDEDPVVLKEEIRQPDLLNPLIAPVESDATVVAETTELVSDPSDRVPPVSSTIVSGTTLASGTQNPEEETNEIKHVEEEPNSKEAELPDPSVTATPDSSADARPGTETLEEDERVELVKEEIKEAAELADATPVAVSDVRPIAEPNKETKDAGPDHEEEIKEVELCPETPATEAVEELAKLKPEAMLPEVETEGPKFPDTSAAETGEEENKETALIKEEATKSELPDSSLAATTVVDAESTPDTKTTEVAAVADVHSKKDKTLDEVKDEHADAAENADGDSEVAQVLPEKKKKKKPLGAHLADEKANDSVNATKPASDENSESGLPESEQPTGAVAPKETTDISARDVSPTDGAIIQADEKEEDKQAAENAAHEVTATDVPQEWHGEKLTERESVVAAEAAAAKEEAVSKFTPRSSNNILSKVKHQIVKVKKAIIRKSPSSKNMPVENKDDIKVK